MTTPIPSKKRDMDFRSCLLIIPLFLLIPVRHAERLRRWLRYKLRVRQIYQPRPDDIFIATYPKSGTTLMQMMLYQILFDGSMDIPHIASVSRWFEFEIESEWGKRESFEALLSPRFFKSHLNYEELPKKGRYIYIARDIRDVAVSNYHQRCLMTGADHDCTQFMEEFLLRPRSWFKSLESWWPHRNDENVLFLTYEGILRDLEGSIRRVAAFCGIEIDESSLPRIVGRCEIGFMKQHWQKFDPRLHRISRTPAELIRQGVAGLGREALNASQRERVEQRLRELAARLGCSPGESYSELFT
jgi:hypothetical protein